MTQFPKWRKLIDGGLAEVPEWAVPECSELQEAVKYVLSSGGKRLRALLVLSVASDLKPARDLQPLVSAATGLECIHAASLVHDDLPALDNDDMRRGRPSCHRAFSEATAILVGDLLVGAGFSCIARSGLEPLQQSRLSALLGSTWTKLCVGQALDLKKSDPGADAFQIMTLKTGALFGCASGAGAICAGCSMDETDAWVEWGTRLGVLFQRIDDVLDGDVPRSSTPDLLVTLEHLKHELTPLMPSVRVDDHLGALLAELIPQDLQHSSHPLE